MNHNLDCHAARTHDLLAAILKHIPYGVAVLDTEMHYIAYSDRWIEDYHLPRQSLIGLSHYEVFPEIGDEWKQIHQECLSGGVHTNVDEPFPRRDGSIDYVSWKLSPWKDQDGKVAGLLMFSTVSTPQVIAEKQNRQYEKEMRILLELTKAIPWRMECATETFTYMGPQIEVLLGYPADSWKDMQTWVSRIHPDDRDKALTLCRDQTAKGLDHDFEYRTVSARGEVLWLRDVVSVIKDAQGEIVALAGMFIDITEQKAAEERLSTSEEQYRSVIETSADGFWLVDYRGYIIETNDAYVRNSGYSKEELQGMHISDLEAQEKPTDTTHHIATIMEKGSDLFESRHRKKSGDIWDVEVSTSYVTSSGGRFFVFIRDISERKRTQRELRLIAEVFENTSEGIVITDPNGVIISVNEAYCEITGYSREEMIGEKPSKIKSDRHDEAFYRNMWQSLLEDGYWVGEIWDRRKNGEVFPKWLSINAVHDEQGKLTHYVGTFSDISVLKGIEHELEQMAYFDPLTGLPNRTLFKDRVENEINRCQRYGYQFALLFMDLDRFKLINDTLGHTTGDELLIEVGRRIQNNIRSNDTVARMGGDEFMMLLTTLPNPDAAASVAQNVINEMTKPIHLKGEEIRVGGSIGITIYPDDGENYNTLTRHADAAMYEAKNSGRGQYHFYSDYMDRAAHEHLNLERDLHRALETEQFSLVFQPQVDARSGRMVRCEALIRWQHPERGLVSPAQFIPIAEDAGLIIPIGDWVIREVCRQLCRWRKSAYDVVPVAINLSARQFRQDGLVEHIMAILEEYAIPVELIEFEITETVAMENAESTLGRLSELAERGFSIAIDDFGTGYSSLSYLKTFPVNKLKLDRSFVMDIPADTNDAAISSAVIHMANSLGHEVVAEGVETEEQKAFLLGQGCNIMQGYFYSRPLACEQFLEYLSAHTSARVTS